MIQRDESWHPFVSFNGKHHNVKLLKLAIRKATVVLIEAGTMFHKNGFELDEAREEYLSDSKHPVVTPFEGKMVVIGSRKLLPPEVYADPDFPKKNERPFKAILVTKYNVNQTRLKETPRVDVSPPIYEPEPEARRPFNPPKFVNERPTTGRVSQYGNHK